jgi:uncharacterized NAD-dependent epimerase/dehydratase family protein
MSWESVLKINDATKLLRTMLTISKEITSKDEMKLQAHIMARQVRALYGMEPKLESIKNAITESMNVTWRDPDMAEKLLRNDPSIIRELERNNLSIDDVDWEEISAAVLSVYDKAIDALTEADLR